jgi:predicted transcriptional regulator
VSGLPNPTQAAELVTALREVDAVTISLDEKRNQATQLKREIDQLVERHTQLVKQVTELVTAMDCASPGNFGYERRMFQLLLMVTRPSAPAP